MYIFQALQRLVLLFETFGFFFLIVDLSDFNVLIPGNLDSDKRQYTVTGLVPFNSYQFRVVARNRFPQLGEYSKPSGISQLYTLYEWLRSHWYFLLVTGLIKLIYQISHSLFSFTKFDLFKRNYILLSIQNIFSWSRTYQLFPFKTLEEGAEVKACWQFHGG